MDVGRSYDRLLDSIEWAVGSALELMGMAFTWLLIVVLFPVFWVVSLFDQPEPVKESEDVVASHRWASSRRYRPDPVTRLAVV